MFEEIFTTEEFAKAFKQLPAQKQKIVQQKISYLSENQKHPSLKTHQLWRLGNNIWDCYIDRGHGGTRLLYEIRGKTLLLWRIGGHDIVDHATRSHFAESTLFQPWLMHLKQEAKPEGEEGKAKPVSYRPKRKIASAERSSSSTEINYFTYFPDAHLRMFGVPEHLLAAVKQANTVH